MMLETLDALQALVQAGSGDDDGNGKIIVLALLAGGPAYYVMIYLKYRNVSKRHKHESETKAEIANVMAGDVYSHANNRQRSSKMSGANNNTVRGAQKSWF